MSDRKKTPKERSERSERRITARSDADKGKGTSKGKGAPKENAQKLQKSKKGKRKEETAEEKRERMRECIFEFVSDDLERLPVTINGMRRRRSRWNKFIRESGKGTAESAQKMLCKICDRWKPQIRFYKKEWKYNDVQGTCMVCKDEITDADPITTSEEDWGGLFMNSEDQAGRTQESADENSHAMPGVISRPRSEKRRKIANKEQLLNRASPRFPSSSSGNPPASGSGVYVTEVCTDSNINSSPSSNRGIFSNQACDSDQEGDRDDDREAESQRCNRDETVSALIYPVAKMGRIPAKRQRINTGDGDPNGGDDDPNSGDDGHSRNPNTRPKANYPIRRRGEAAASSDNGGDDDPNNGNDNQTNQPISDVAVLSTIVQKVTGNPKNWNRHILALSIRDSEMNGLLMEIEKKKANITPRTSRLRDDESPGSSPDGDHLARRIQSRSPSRPENNPPVDVRPESLSERPPLENDSEFFPIEEAIEEAFRNALQGMLDIEEKMTKVEDGKSIDSKKNVGSNRNFKIRLKIVETEIMDCSSSSASSASSSAGSDCGMDQSMIVSQSDSGMVSPYRANSFLADYSYKANSLTTIPFISEKSRISRTITPMASPKRDAAPRGREPTPLPTPLSQQATTRNPIVSSPMNQQVAPMTSMLTHNNSFATQSSVDDGKMGYHTAIYYTVHHTIMNDDGTAITDSHDELLAEAYTSGLKKHSLLLAKLRLFLSGSGCGGDGLFLSSSGYFRDGSKRNVHALDRLSAEQVRELFTRPSRKLADDKDVYWRWQCRIGSTSPRRIVPDTVKQDIWRESIEKIKKGLPSLFWKYIISDLLGSETKTSDCKMLLDSMVRACVPRACAPRQLVAEDPPYCGAQDQPEALDPQTSLSHQGERLLLEDYTDLLKKMLWSTWQIGSVLSSMSNILINIPTTGYRVIIPERILENERRKSNSATTASPTETDARQTSSATRSAILPILESVATSISTQLEVGRKQIEAMSYEIDAEVHGAPLQSRDWERYGDIPFTVSEHQKTNTLTIQTGVDQLRSLFPSNADQQRGLAPSSGTGSADIDGIIEEKDILLVECPNMHPSEKFYAEVLDVNKQERRVKIIVKPILNEPFKLARFKDNGNRNAVLNTNAQRGRSPSDETENSTTPRGHSRTQRGRTPPASNRPSSVKIHRLSSVVWMVSEFTMDAIRGLYCRMSAFPWSPLVKKFMESWQGDAGGANTLVASSTPSDTTASGGLTQRQELGCELALAHNLALIQGPPGTGKTFFGANLVKRIQNNTKSPRPVLCVFQSNEACNNFSEKLDELKVPHLRYEGHTIEAAKHISRQNALCDNARNKLWEKFASLIDAEHDIIVHLRGVLSELHRLEKIEARIETVKENGGDFGISNNDTRMNSIIDSDIRMSTPTSSCTGSGNHIPFATLNTIEELQDKRDEIEKGLTRKKTGYLARFNQAVLKATTRKGKKLPVLTTIARSNVLDQNGEMKFEHLILDEAATVTDPGICLTLAHHPHLKFLTMIGDHKQNEPVVKSREANDRALNVSVFERLTTWEKHSQHPWHSQQQVGNVVHENRITGISSNPTAFTGEAVVPMVMLNQQWRMHSTISAFPNTTFYDEAIVDGMVQRYNENRDRNSFEISGIQSELKLRQRIRGFDWVRLPISATSPSILSESGLVISQPDYYRVAFVDTAGMTESRSGVSFKEVPAGTSWKNHGEADLVTQILKDILAKQKAGNTLSVGIIAGYRGQRDCIQDCIDVLTQSRILESDGSRQGDDLLNATVDIQVGTIDAFQGREKDLIILSLTRTEMLGFMSKHNRVNVCLSRAKSGLVVVGNSICMSKPSTNEMIRSATNPIRNREANPWISWLDWIKSHGLWMECLPAALASSSSSTTTNPPSERRYTIRKKEKVPETIAERPTENTVLNSRNNNPNTKPSKALAKELKALRERKENFKNHSNIYVVDGGNVLNYNKDIVVEEFADDEMGADAETTTTSINPLYLSLLYKEIIKQDPNAFVAVFIYSKKIRECLDNEEFRKCFATSNGNDPMLRNDFSQVFTVDADVNVDIDVISAAAKFHKVINKSLVVDEEFQENQRTYSQQVYVISNDKFDGHQNDFTLRQRKLLEEVIQIGFLISDGSSSSYGGHSRNVSRGEGSRRGRTTLRDVPIIMGAHDTHHILFPPMQSGWIGRQRFIRENPNPTSSNSNSRAVNPVESTIQSTPVESTIDLQRPGDVMISLTDVTKIFQGQRSIRVSALREYLSQYAQRNS